MNKYSSGLVSESFWFLEVKKIVKLLNADKTWDDVRHLCLNENLLGLVKVCRAKRVFGYLKNRIDTLDKRTLALFDESDLQTQKIINLIAISKQNKLFYEFLYEVYREKVTLGSIELTPSDINIFFKHKAEQDTDIEAWSEVTLKRLRSAYMNFLTDAGLLTVINKTHKITPPMLDIELERHLADINDTQMIKALTGVE